MRPLLTSCFGKQTFKHSTTQARVVGWRITPEIKNGEPLNYKDSMFSQKLLKTASSRAVNSGATKHNGQWYFYDFEQPEEDMLLKITIQKRAARVETANSNLLFLLKDTGPSVRISATPIPDADAALNHICLLYAKGYVVTPKQCKDLWGMQIPRHELSNKFDPEEVEEDFEIVAIGGGTPDLKTEVNPVSCTTQTATIKVARPRRRLIV
jgi:hypothetical protein